MPLPDTILESRLDLSIARIQEPAPGQLVVSSIMTSSRGIVAGVFGLACVLCLVLVWRQRSQGWLVALYPWGLLAPILGVIAIVMAFGEQSKTVDAAARRAELRARLGPFGSTRSYPLSPKGRIRISLRRELPSHASRHTTATATRWYDVDIVDQPALGFTLASDRAAARAFAARLAKLLDYEVQDEVEDDGVTRLEP
jgi:hypothetical protein